MERKLLVPFVSALKKVHIFKYVSTTNRKKFSTTGITIRAPSRTLRCLFSLHLRELLTFLEIQFWKCLCFIWKQLYLIVRLTVDALTTPNQVSKTFPRGVGIKDCCQHVNKGNEFVHVRLHLSLIFGSCWPCMFFLGQLFHLSQNKEHSSAP